MTQSILLLCVSVEAAAGPGEPTLAELRTAAVARSLVEPERAASMVSRARRAPWLPELRFRVDQRFGRSESLDDAGAPLPNPLPVDLDTVNDIRYEIRATWDLGRLVFNPDELSAHAEALRMADVRKEIESTVVRLHFERRRLRRTPPAADETEAARRSDRVEEIEAELESLTGRPFFRKP